MDVSGALERGARSYLRHPVEQDRQEFLERVRASRRLHRPWSYPPDTPEGFDELLERAQRVDVETLFLARSGDDAITGTFTLSQIVHGSFRNAFLGYYVLAPFDGQGYMHEGIRLAIRYAFGPLRLHRLQADIQPGNEASIALVRGAGFRREGLARRYLKIGGRWRDHEMWAVVAEDVARTARRSR